MPRPRKWRRVCSLPYTDKFGPYNSMASSEPPVVMGIDEYETIRLIDLEGLTQEECAMQMNIARTTVQGIYNTARSKLAESLVYGKILLIEGGEYKLCDGDGMFCGGNGCHKHRRGCQMQSESRGKNTSGCKNTSGYKKISDCKNTSDCKKTSDYRNALGYKNTSDYEE